MRWRHRDISGIAGVAALVAVALLLLGLGWLVCATFYVTGHVGGKVGM